MGLLNWISHLFLYMFGLLYPSYHTFHYFYQIKKYPTLKDPIVVEELLHHYVVISLNISVFWFSDFFFFWLPFYDEVKLLFIVWLVLPTTLGTLVLYDRVVEPFFTLYKSQLDFFFHSFETTFFVKLLNLIQFLFRFGKEILGLLLLKLFQQHTATTTSSLFSTKTTSSSSSSHPTHFNSFSSSSSFACSTTETTIPPPSSSSSSFYDSTFSFVSNFYPTLFRKSSSISSSSSSPTHFSSSISPPPPLPPLPPKSEVTLSNDSLPPIATTTTTTSTPKIKKTRKSKTRLELDPLAS